VRRRLRGVPESLRGHRLPRGALDSGRRSPDWSFGPRQR
jgi:hypothetical protein